MAFTATEIIERRPEEVWAYLTDWERCPEWMPGIDAMSGIEGATTAVGSRITFSARGGEHAAEITACEAGRRLTLRSKQGGMTADYTYRLEPEGGATRVTLDAGCRAEGLLWRLASPLISLAMARADRVQPARLKAALEKDRAGHAV